jgi:transposase
MPGQAINATLDLEGLEVIGVVAFDHLIELVVESRFDAGACRSCGGLAPEPKERPEVLVRDLAISGRPVVLRWRKRRWRCTYCQSSWTETHPQIPSRARMTLRFKEHLADQAAAQGNFSQVALQEGVSYDTVARAHKARAELVRMMRPRPAPNVISIDEAAMRKGGIYNTVITDVLARYVVDTVQGRSEKALVRWFSTLDEEVKDGIEVVVMDLWDPYRAIVSRALPHAVRVARQVPRPPPRKPRSGSGPQAFSGPRQTQDGLVAAPVRLPLRTAAVARERRSARPRAPRGGLRGFPQVHQAWRLKEGMREVYQESDPQDAALALDVWLQLAERSDIPEFKKLAATVRRWRPEILNHFIYRMTNAYAEGITNRVKVIKRLAYGLTNFANFHDWILVQCGTPKALRVPA